MQQLVADGAHPQVMLKVEPDEVASATEHPRGLEEQMYRAEAA